MTARQKTRRAADLLGFKTQDQSRLATAVSELVRNIFQYAGSGFVEFVFLDQATQALCVRAVDRGPGIADVDQILTGEYRSSTGMGIGLVGSKKLMDIFTIDSAVGRGTTVTIGKHLPARAPRIPRAGLPRIAEDIARQPTTTPFEEMQQQNGELLRALDEVRRAQDDLRELNRELGETNRGVVALYAELDEKATALQKANEMKTRFLSNMTHEFRTPLSSIISLTNILQLHLDGDLTAEQERQVKYIRQSGEALLELVNDLLDVAKVEAGRVSINVTEFDLDEVMSGLRGMFRPVTTSTINLDLSVGWDTGATPLSTDEAKVTQVLRNLISNAIKFTDRGDVTVTAELTAEDQVHVRVVDTGVGVAEADRTLIFEEFGQVGTGRPGVRGTGLGLPLSRRLARLLGGDVWVESRSGPGSTFHFRIPRRYRGEREAVLLTPEPEPASRSGASGQDRFNILIIDDDEASRYVVKGLVSREVEACFTEVTGGRAGLGALRLGSPDLVILDLNMDDMSGFELLRAIRHRLNAPDVPILVNTARDLTPAEREFLDGVTVGILSKDRTDERRSTEDLRRALTKAGFDYQRG